MNIIQETIRSVHVFTPPATLGKPRNNFVSCDNFGPYCNNTLINCLHFAEIIEGEAKNCYLCQ